MKSNNQFVVILGAASFLMTASIFAQVAGNATPTLEIDLTQPGATINPQFYGLMTEEINHSYDGGLYAELIQNRSFKDAGFPVHWSVVESGSMELDQTQPVNDALTTCLKLETGPLGGGKRSGIANEGYWGVPVKPDLTYHASFYAKASGAGGNLSLSIESADGETIYAQADGPKVSSQWQRYAVTLKARSDVQPATGNFVISTTDPGTYWFNLVSLFPPTFHDRPNGNRVDLMQKMADLKPSFLRCPGGNYLEGDSIDTRFNWKHTLGDISTRPGHMGTWRYRSSDGMGLLEFMEWAEDMGAEPVLAVWAGFSLSNPEHPGGSTVMPGADLAPYVQDAVDEIEYVTGSTTTKWGAQRAKDGHPAPFPLHYVEIGNEDFAGDARRTYDARFAQFYDALKAAYPNLQTIATIPVHSRKADVVDDHYYKTSDEMATLAHKYDHQDRSGPKVFVGEWATREIVKSGSDGSISLAWMPWGYKGAPTPDFHAALGDAAFMTGLERNADIVVMNCYAPLLVRVDPGAFQWCPNLIGFNSLSSYSSPSYYAQQIFSMNRGDKVAKITAEAEPKGLFYSATTSSSTGAVYLKVVNRAEVAETVQINVTGAAKVSPDGAATVLTAEKPFDTNIITDPAKIVPVTTPLHGMKPSFTHVFPPYSITALQINTR
jgi:alpha-N-arabinofuranosidase